ncbi:alcaligin biosynthesis protein AlcD [Bordetella holmesii]|uniref:Siderophore ferric iron reductase, AHA_1954 family n=2 Tax=Bordetella holmesii TaxID=35814 RepID=A0A158M1M4_9BORD|nr:alcaligin biosynthesis protein AlcD [Bordetella holmesii]AHV91628.1 hypothetical protein D560_3392 [Bordetella holmesii ATCC 51541]AIT28008.1 hypothetical protein D558_3368 [Bordetella holmesii 44057]EWM40783.1 hypothetical protein D555_3428 [Bordetella holmesii 35009]EWM42111.1 hypothetical protein D556_3361 [Bordetella holmesii 41130]EWM44679.1 hypothetical protein D557_2668 [Bordetella holmesii 70147]
MSWDIAAQTGAGVAQDINRTACSDLDALLALAGSLVPGLDGRIGPVSGDIRPGADNRATLRTLQDWWRLRHPEAGSHYLALRCWGLLIWQPIYLGVIAVHCSDIAPDLDRLGQPVRDGFIAGYILERHEPLRGCLEQRKQAVAAQLRRICATYFRELSQLLRLSPRAAACMQADCVLSALLAARANEDKATVAWAHEQAADWLDRLGIAGHSGYLVYARAGRPVLALDRQVCCHHFRRHDGDYCSTCPKLPPAERIARIEADEAAA